jgi:D-glycero-beta-D-manno-heptose 1-phosphate adenylyltransferase
MRDIFGEKLMMKFMVSYNIIYKLQNPTFFENVEIIRLNSPWYTKEELVDIFKNNSHEKFLDINIKYRSKRKIMDHDYKELLELAVKYDVEWVGISNVEDVDTLHNLQKYISNSSTKICAKIETQKGYDNFKDIMSNCDGIMVDLEDLAYNVGWEKATKMHDEIYHLCEEKQIPHYKLTGVIFQYKSYVKTVYTYGAFDLIHPGHVILLNKAKSYGDYLVVGIVGDEAIKELKGPERPVQPIQDRMKIISSLKCVDQVIEQTDYDPIPNLEKINPDILVKGDDWEYIPGQDWIQEHGKKLIKPPYSGGWSSSAMIKKIKNI